MQQRLIRAGDIIRAHGHRGLWKVIATRPRGRGTQITATRLDAYPRIDLTIPESRVRPAHQDHHA